MHQQQPNRSKTCGQHCVAMLAGIPVAKVIEQFGRKGTTASKVLEIAKAFGLEPETALWQLPRDSNIPRTGILKLRKARRKRFHWACVIDGVIHDPACSTEGELLSDHVVTAFISLRGK